MQVCASIIRSTTMCQILKNMMLLSNVIKTWDIQKFKGKYDIVTNVINKGCVTSTKVPTYGNKTLYKCYKHSNLYYYGLTRRLHPIRVSLQIPSHPF